MVRTIAVLLSQLLSAPNVSETVEIGGRETIDLATFECRDINRSTVLQRVCYDRTRSDLIVAIGGNYHRYCNVSAATADDLLGAPSMGQFFDRNIRRQVSGHRYDCPTRASAPQQGSRIHPAQSVSIAPTSASATTWPLTLASPWNHHIALRRPSERM